jgi:hypothetical protein
LTVVYSQAVAGPVKARFYNSAFALAARAEAYGQVRDNNQLKVDVTGWAWGVFYVVLDTPDGRLGPQKFVVGN